jgi:hypothetical protein
MLGRSAAVSGLSHEWSLSSARAIGIRAEPGQLIGLLRVSQSPCLHFESPHEVKVFPSPKTNAIIIIPNNLHIPPRMM